MDDAYWKPNPNGKCLATNHDQPLLGDQTCWCCAVWPNDIKHDWTNKMLTIVVQMFVVAQILSNTIRHSVLTGKRLVTKQCLIAKHFPFRRGLSMNQLLFMLDAIIISHWQLKWAKCTYSIPLLQLGTWTRSVKLMSCQTLWRGLDTSCTPQCSSTRRRKAGSNEVGRPWLYKGPVNQNLWCHWCQR